MPEFDATVEYRPIPEFPGYMAGNDGTIWTCRERGGPRQWRLGDHWTEMTPNISKQYGYKRLSVTDAEGRRRCRFVHLLVLQAFAGPCPDGMQARHLNGDKLNCRTDNLAWGTVQENHDDKQRHGTTARGERDGNAKLTEEQVRQIRLLAAQGTFLREIARHFDVSDVNVEAIVRRRTWQHTDSDIPIPELLPTQGERHPNSKLTADIVREIRLLSAGGMSQHSIASRFDINQNTVWKVIHRRTWDHVE